MSSFQNIVCPIHREPIGGVCDEISCDNPHTLMCMKCVNNVNSCVRKNNHQSISLEEFLDNYFNIYLNELHTANDTSQRVNTIEHFCKNCQEIYDNFNQENEKIGSEMITIFQSFIDKINNLFVKFNQDFISYIKMKQDELNKALGNLLQISYYDQLEGFNKEALWNKICNCRDYHSLNQLIFDMKTSVLNLSSDMANKDIDKVKSIMNISGDNVINYFKNEFKNLNNEADKKFNLYSEKIKEKMFNNDKKYPSQNMQTMKSTMSTQNKNFNQTNMSNPNNNTTKMFNMGDTIKTVSDAFVNESQFSNTNFSKTSTNIPQNDDEDKLNLSQFNCIYEAPIDYTSFANFQNKKFVIFEHSNGTTFLAYPTSSNTINIEYLDKFIDDATISTPVTNQSFQNKNKQIKSNIFNARPQKIDDSQNKVSSRQKYLYFTLSSHSQKINELIYYRSSENKDYLLSSSDDCTIKIWEITDLHKYLKDVNSFYRCNCVKTLMGHQGRIISLKTYYDPLKGINYIISLGYGDKIKVWNLLTGQLIRNIYDKDDFSSTVKDNFMEIANVNKFNYLFTANSMSNKISVWNFDTGDIISVLQYNKGKGYSNPKIIGLNYINLNDQICRLYIIDDIGSCCYIDVLSNSDLNDCKFSLQDKNDTRTGSFIFGDGQFICVYCKNGFVYQYSIYDHSLVDRKKLGNNTFISYAMEYVHHTRRRLIALHCGDMHLKIFN